MSAAEPTYPHECDPSTKSNVLRMQVTHIDIDWTVHFESSTIDGSVVLTARSVTEEVTALVLDVNHLNITKVTSVKTGNELAFSVDEPGALGSALTIPLTEDDRDTDTNSFGVQVFYNTTPKGSAVQWLAPSATKDKLAPFCFTQCQAIHARSLLPCQDTPTVKATYKANVRCPKGVVAIMSALGNGDEPIAVHSDGSSTFAFNQPIAMASYLVALAVGQLVSKPVGPRSAVWAEPSVVDAAAFEFVDTEKFIATGEQICGPYQWTRYDILCMPPSFPFGGMENPCLTFATPTLLAGDRSLANVIFHEVAHSWTGNLVTNRTWEHFWINEGWTMFVERKIGAALFGQKFADLDAIEGIAELQEDIDDFGAEHNFSRLIPNLAGDGDPDDAFSSVPYEKGFALLKHIEHVVGGPKNMDPFIRAYVSKFGHPTMTITSEELREFATQYFQQHHDLDLEALVDWREWFFKPGMPKGTRELLDDSLLNEVNALLRVWTAEGDHEPTAGDIDGWTCVQTTILLKQLLTEHVAALTVKTLDQMDQLYRFSDSRNAEIKFNWQRLCIAVGKADVLPSVIDFLKAQGRLKFIRPLYKDLLKAGKGTPFHTAGIDTFREAKDSYHPIAQKMIERDIAGANADVA